MCDSDNLSTELPCYIRVDYSKCVNFAFQQNSIPILRRIEIQNNTEQDWYSVQCRIETSPDWAEVFKLDVVHIPAGTAYTITDVPLNLSIEYLVNLSERVRGAFRVEVWGTENPSLEGELGSLEKLHEQAYPVDVYAHDEWTGLRSLPEILAAFVTPNLSVVEQLLSNTAQLLGTRTGISAIDGYQANSKKRIYEILDAIYDALRDQAICYSNPCASFEQTGQRVRFGPRIMKSKLATCLDLSLLFAGVLEQAGLNSLILMHKGHAYVGCWLVEDSFSESAIDDLQAIRKRKELEELLVFESTLVCEGKKADFQQAVSAAQAHLLLDDEFECAIDLFRCRSSRIHPLPLERNDGDIDIQKARRDKKNTVNLATSRAKNIEFKDELNVDNVQQTPEGRIEHWKQQLLDLTLRNRLLNFKETKRTIPLLCPKPEHMEDELAADQKFKVLEQTPLVSGADPRSLSLQVQQNDEDPVVEHLMRELYAKRLRSSLTERELSRRLLELYRRVRLENEESGANTLFLALGLLEWKQNKDDDRSYRAPLLLVPVQLERKSVQSGFSLRRHDEDTLMNVTLLELLKRDYQLDVPGVNPPPEDDSGVDVDKVFRLFQHAVRDLPGWEVHREVWLSQFSFNKFLLWKDLQDRADVLGRNRVVDHLMNHPGEPFLDDLEDIDPRELDGVAGFEEIFCPMSSDSSQLAATFAAANGKNFVMNGPPGTGKSQTITNIIAHCLASGKRVLFVAEKRAALEVVHHRLSQIGLSPFCLELHSNKSGKAEVLRQFGKAINYVEQHPSEEWETLAQHLNDFRNELNNYVRELHKVYPNKLNAYHCYTWLLAHADIGDTCRGFDSLSIPNIEEHSQESRETLEEVCEQLMLRGSKRRLPMNAKDAFQPVKATEWTPQWEDKVITVAEELLDKIQLIRPLWQGVAEKLGLPKEDAARQVLDCVAKLTASLCGAPLLPSEFIAESNWGGEFKPLAESWIASGRRRDEALAKLDKFDVDALLAVDTDAIESAYKATEKKKGLFCSLKLWSLLKPVRRARKAGTKKWATAEAPEFFKHIGTFKTEKVFLDDAKANASAHFGQHWNDGSPDWNRLQELLNLGDQLHNDIQKLAGDSIDLLVQLRRKIGDLLSVGSEFLQEGGSIHRLFNDFGVAWDALSDVSQKHGELLSLQPPEAPYNLLDWTEKFCTKLSENKKYLSEWCRWQSSFQQAEAGGLSALLSALNTKKLPLENLRDAFDYAYRNTFLKRLLTCSSVLRNFYGEEHQKRINAFKDFDERYTKLTGQVVAARLAAKLPRARNETCPVNTELGMIQREMVKRRRHKPVRQLLAETPGVSPFLKPCFLMSPLSVAQYLDAEQSDFDVVVFDEASQIPVWDAVGAIARGKQMIVVGDPKQLPPTNFFSRSDQGDDAIIDVNQPEDLESILDECLGSGLKVYNLLWHYRSRKEGLIAFSNYHYYGNELHTFPSPHSSDVGVSLVPVPQGFYDKGKSRTNKAEAEMVTKEVIRRLNDPVLSRMSIGIVTFSQAQQNLIMDLLDEARRSTPEIEGHFSEEVDEPVFVKNLENVQGDERDVILFSICYGPDQNGRLSMNFGPLNRDGGERRLNVAVTRAKHEVVVFSTLRSEQIDLSRTRAIGAAHLKSYLEYAERGPATIAANIESAATEDYDSIFEKEVAEMLRGKGYTVHTQIGCSGYRIDLAIVHPDEPGKYLLGIECDGATYHRAATARDRDRLRQAVLEGLGWRIYRIWSTDWWRNSEVAKQDLFDEVEDALKSPAEADPPAVSDDPEGKAKPEPELYASNVSASSPEIDERKQDYPEITLHSFNNSDRFYTPEGRHIIKTQIKRIIENEGPITSDLITRRVAQEWGFSRVASKITQIVQSCLPDKAGNTTFWPDSIDPNSYRLYRIATRDVRKFEDVPTKELCNAALDILEKYITFPKEDFASEIARHFGFSRVTKSTAEVCVVAIREMVKYQIIKLEDEAYRLI